MESRSRRGEEFITDVTDAKASRKIPEAQLVVVYINVALPKADLRALPTFDQDKLFGLLAH